MRGEFILLFHMVLWWKSWKNRAFRRFESSVWKLLDCRILHQIPKGFWEPWEAPKPPAVSNEPPYENFCLRACSPCIPFTIFASQVSGWPFAYSHLSGVSKRTGHLASEDDLSLSFFFLLRNSLICNQLCLKKIGSVHFIVRDNRLSRAPGHTPISTISMHIV